MTMITNTQALADFCARLSQCPYVTIDTEFIREKTYWPNLCLVQLAGPGVEAKAVDPLVDGLELTPLFDLVANEAVLKVFHAARQDLEIFYNLTGAVPKPLFDTQIAAMVCGFGDSVSYESLVAKLANAKVDKSSRFTDWAQRPLTEKQIAYALADVTHLRVAYEKLAVELERSGRASWLVEEMDVLTNPTTYDPDPRQAYLRIKGRGNKGRVLAILRELAAWRELAARQRNLPRNRLLRDEALLEIAHHPPDSVADLLRIRGMGKKLAEGPMGQAILAAVTIGLKQPEKDWPKPPARASIPPGSAVIADILKVLLKMSCQASGVASKLVATSADVERIAAFGEEADVPALKGWRRAVFGDDALNLRAGSLALSVEKGRLELVELEP